MHLSLALAGVLLLALLYLVAMRAALPYARVDQDTSASDRDNLYLVLHLALLGLAGLTGWLLGRWLGGLGVAYATLFVISSALWMVGAQVASYQLACDGNNDLIRHWTC